MGLWSMLFRDDGGSDTPTVKVSQSKEDTARMKGEKYVHHGGESHEHYSYNLDTASGQYREYYGGENGNDRSYNKGDDRS